MVFQFKSLILLFISICLFTTSCKKDDSIDTDSFPTTLHLKSLTFNDEVKVYTKDGEITTPLIKTQSIISTGINLISHPQPDTSNRLTFSSNNLFLFSNDSYFFEKLNDTFIFKYVDSSVVHGEDNLVAVSPFYKYPTARKNNDGNFIYRRQFVGHGDYSAINISGMDLCILKRDTITGAITKRLIGYELNEFNVDGIKSLGKYDTLSVRQYSYLYTKNK